MLKMNMIKFIPTFCFFYTGFAIYIFKEFFYYEEIGSFFSISILALIFVPLF